MTCQINVSEPKHLFAFDSLLSLKSFFVLALLYSILQICFTESGRIGAQYERAAARPGTPLRLAGVFADGSKAKAPKYAQLIDPQGNVSIS